MLSQLGFEVPAESVCPGGSSSYKEALHEPYAYEFEFEFELQFEFELEFGFVRRIEIICIWVGL